LARGKKKDETNDSQLHRNTEANIHNVENKENNLEDTTEQSINSGSDISEELDEATLEQRWLERILNHPVKVLEIDEKSNNKTFIEKTVKDIIDPEQDIWYSVKKKKPIISDPGTKKLIAATGTTFPKIIPIEKQSDFPSKEREQVWIEATALFPDGTTNEDYGIANRMNCQDPISGSNLPIMARKRARHRAFYRSDYIGLYEINDENEVLEAREEKEQKLQNQYRMLEEKLKQQELKNKKLANQLCKEIKTESGELVWSINDQAQLLQLGKGTSLTSYVALLKIRHLAKKEAANS